jgi:hypothetical protein
MKLEHVTFALLGLLLGLAAYAVAGLFWYAMFWWANNPAAFA